MNRKRLLLALLLGLALVLICTASALADDPLKVQMEFSKKQFSGPETITVTITVTNVGEGDMPGPVTLYYPSGKRVEEFGSPTLTVGSSKTWKGEWTVTQSELESGKIGFRIDYTVYDEEQDTMVLKKKGFSKKIIYTGADPEITVSAHTATPTLAQQNQEVTVTYEITNSGVVDVTDVVIKENSSISTKTETIDSIPAGETVRRTFAVTMGKKDLTSQATISYKAGGKTFTAKSDKVTVKYGEVDLSAKLTADRKGGSPGDPLKLTLVLTNKGTVDFTNVTVTDPTLGVIFSGETVAANSTLTLEKELTITETMDLQFTVTAEDATGIPTETATGVVHVIAMDPTQQIVLSVDAQADRETVYKIPGTVRFTVNVHNDSTVEVKNITVRAVNVNLYTFDSIPAGGTASFTRDLSVSMAGSFQFTANCKDQLGQALSFASNIIPIRYADPTPVPTEAPVVTPPAPQLEPVPTETEPLPAWMDTVSNIVEPLKWVFAGLAGLLLVLLLIGAVRRGKSRSESKKAMDHLEGATYRDYSSAPRGGRRSEIVSGRKEEAPPAPEAPETPENTEQNSELMAETLRKLYSEKPAEAAPEAVEAPIPGMPVPGVPEEAAAAVQETAEAAAEAAAEAPAQAEAPVESARDAAHRRRAKK